MIHELYKSDKQRAQRCFNDKLRSILLPLPTPYSADCALDPDALKRNIEKWSATGIAGFVMLGSTGERVHLDEREYLQVIRVARESVPSELAFIVGAGQQSTRGTINEINLAAEAGADAVLVITPFFYRAAITQTALIDHYAAIADAAPVPVLLYSMPALTGIRIEPETIARLSAHANITGVKDSAADMEKFGQTVQLVRRNLEPEQAREDFAVFTGNGTVLCEALEAGADGGILAVGCVAPELCLDVLQAVRTGKREAARTLQQKLTPLAQAVTTRYGIGGLKTALDLLGYYGGPVRAPLLLPDVAAQNEIRELLRTADDSRLATDH